MPLYTYRCTQCGYIDEFIINVKKRDKKFPCEQDQCTGVMGRDGTDISSFKLKGDCWYKDGYSKKPKPKKKEEKKEEKKKE